MKKMKLLSILGIFVAGFPIESVAQEQAQSLPEIIVPARNYKYLRSVDNKELAQPVKVLERKAAVYNVKSSEYYEEDYDVYFVSFYLPEGYILAEYDATGKLIRTVERFKNVALPQAVRNAVGSKYPDWKITNDFYMVKYQDTVGAQESRKNYKLLLENGDKRLHVLTNGNGELIE